jgi:hypothetical protein
MVSALHLKTQRIPLKNLLLDPNNPRFFDLEDWQKVPENLYHLERVQLKASQRLESSQAWQITELEQSIRSNGYIPTELIVVKPYVLSDPVLNADQGPYFVVIEGNRRLAAIRKIVREALNPEQDELVQSLQTLNVLVYTPTEDPEQDRINETILQGIRHISGPKEWGAYQKAHLIVQLHDTLRQSWTEIGQRLGLGARVVGRYYRAYKALRQMMDDEEFGPKAKPRLFSLFDEALKSNAIKEWLGWSEELWQFTNAERRPTFYGLLVGDLEGERGPEITNPQQMRQFGETLASKKVGVLERFIEGELTIERAVSLTKIEPITVPLRDSLRTFLQALEKFPASLLTTITEEDLQVFERIEKKLQQLRALRQASLQYSQERAANE